LLQAFSSQHNKVPQQSLQPFAHHPARFKELSELALFSYTSDTSLQQIENKHLQNAFKALRVDLPGCTTLSTTMLYKAYQDVQKAVKERQDENSAFGLSTDGWCSKFVEKGVPLINACHLSPQGGSTFLKVERAAGVTKDSE
jgi:hypothetical protein